MNKRLLLLFTCAFLIVSLCGCWNYRGLDQMDLVMGIAVDFNRESNKFRVSYEIADLKKSSKTEGIKGKIIEVEGETLLDALRNGKRLRAEKAYMSGAQIVIISKSIVETMKLPKVIDLFFRDGECRETMCLILSQEDTASALLESPEEKSGIVSLDIHDIVKEDNPITASAVHMQLLDVYNAIKTQGLDLTLPVMHKVKTKEEEFCELNGTAVFDKELKLTGFLTPDESKYLLYVQDKISGGLLTLTEEGEMPNHITMEIFKNKTSKSFSYENGNLKLKIKTRTTVGLAENNLEINVMDQEQIKKTEEDAARMVEEKILALVSRMQKEGGADIFGFGEMIYRKDLKLWNEFSSSWPELFRDAEVEVSSQVHISNTALIK